MSLKSELKNGAVVELRNGNRFIKIDDMFISGNGGFMLVKDYDDFLLFPSDSCFDVIKLNNVDTENQIHCIPATNVPLKNANNNKWTWTRPEPILNDKEREYLSAVIKPFRDRVMEIKRVVSVYRDFIVIKLNDDSVYLPFFEKGTITVYSDNRITWKIPGTIDTITHWMELPSLPEQCGTTK